MFRVLALIVTVLLSIGINFAQTDLVFPHISVGAPWETVLQVSSQVPLPVAVTIEVYQGDSAGASNGAPMLVRFDGGNPVAVKIVVLAPYQELSTILSGVDATVRNGWVRVTTPNVSDKVSGSLLFRTRQGNTVTDSVGVGSSQGFRYALIQVDNTEEGSNTGIAVVNPEKRPVGVKIALLQGLTQVDNVSLVLQPGQHFAKFVTEIFPGLGKQQGTMLIETSTGVSLPLLTLRLDGSELTSIPVRPLGFIAKYSVTDPSSAVVERGVWAFDFVGFSLVGFGRLEDASGNPVGTIFPVQGNWSGNSFQFTYRKVSSDGGTGMVLFNGASAGLESTLDGKFLRQPITGKVTTVGANGQAAAPNNFSAEPKF